jgi:mono/diheme cytochrome c family protein
MDSSGHTWHHSDHLLTEIVTNGSPDRRNAMHGFDERLSDDDIAAILGFLETRWATDERQFQWTVILHELQ